MRFLFQGRALHVYFLIQVDMHSLGSTVNPRMNVR